MEKKKVIALIVSVIVVIAVAVVVTLAVVLTTDGNSVQLYDDSYKVEAKAVKTDDGGVVLEYHNIPYATAKRFEYPEVCSNNNTCGEPRYDEVVACLQINTRGLTPVGEEDCLYLTVRTPDKDGNLPVIVWIHGGGLAFGYGEYWSPKSQFVKEVNAVSVNINYRLGMFGFLSTSVLKDEKLKTYGNYGHADQIAALQWVKDNIKNFGGDPSRVTLLGESAGGTSLLALVSSPLANNMFKNVIPLSPALQWSVTNEEANFLPETTDVIKAVGCSGDNDVALCLRTVPALYFVTRNPDLDRGDGYFKFPRQMKKEESNDKVYLTVVDGVIVQKAPIEYGSVSFEPRKPVGVYLSNTAQECTTKDKIANFTAFKEILTKNLEAFEANTDETHFGNANTMAEKIIEAYKIPSQESEAFYNKIYNTIISDIRSTCPGNHLANTIQSNPNINMHRIIFYYSDQQSFYHVHDIEIGFGGEQSSKARKLIQEEFRQFIKDIVHDEVNSEWERYPTGVLYVSDKGAEYSDKIPHEANCKFWETYKMDYQYGWQN